MGPYHGGTTLPYASFVTRPPVVDGGAVALSAAGRCRIHPDTCHQDQDDADADPNAEYRAIVSKTIEQASVDIDVDANNSSTADGLDKETRKKLKKKYMKQGVGMARSYLSDTLGLDTSVIDVEIVLSTRDVKESEGLLASCFLDAGCDKIVLSGTDVEALDAARIPRDRLVAHFDGADKVEIAGAASQLAGTVSIRPNETAEEADAETLLTLITALDDAGKSDGSTAFDVVMELEAGDADADYDAVQILADKIGSISKGCANRKVRCSGISLIDPTVQLLGLSYAACLKTDRDDGLFTTVVCTRSGEALGLVYSSKVSLEQS